MIKPTLMKRKRLRHLIGLLCIVLACIALYWTGASDVPAATFVFAFSTVVFGIAGLMLLFTKQFIGGDNNDEEPIINGWDIEKEDDCDPDFDPLSTY